MADHPHRAKETPIKDMFLRGIAVLGLIAVLLLGAWGIIQIALSLPGVFASIGGIFNRGGSAPAAQESLSVSAPLSSPSGAPLTLSWKHERGTGQSGYTISYSCADGLSMKAPLPNGTYKDVACNTPFNYTNASTSVALTAVNTGASQTATTFTVAAKKLSSGAITSSGTATVSVGAGVAEKPKTPAKKPASSGSYTPAKRAVQLYGYPDLAIRINSVAPSGSRMNVQFTVENIGTNTVPAGWSFQANLPIETGYSAGGYPYYAPAQRALNPGDKIVFTMGYDSASYGQYQQYPQNYGTTPPGWRCGYTYNGQYNYPDCSHLYSTGYGTGYSGSNYNTYNPGIVTIMVDAQNQVWESNENNNTATTGNYNYGQYPQQHQYPSYPQQYPPYGNY